MKISQLIQELDKWAPFNYQESYDNSGLLIGTPDWEVNKALISLDITETIIEEAIQGCFNLIISHHPVIFQGFKSLTGKTAEERVVMAAVKNNIAIISMHTNLDNVAHGVNEKISQVLGLQNTSILEPRSDVLKKLSVFVPTESVSQLRKALFDAGAGYIGNYDQCSFGTEGIGTFRAGEKTNPFVGEIGKFHKEQEIKLELVFPSHLQSQVIHNLIKYHPYEEPAYDIYTLDNKHLKVGAGMVGELPKEMNELEFLQLLKQKMQTGCIRYTNTKDKMIKKVALCGGSGSFLIRSAKAVKADVFITGDVKYHDFFEANNQFMIADIGHYESEQFTKELIHDFLIEKFPKFAVQISEHQTNPIKYF